MEKIISEQVKRNIWRLETIITVATDWILVSNFFRVCPQGLTFTETNIKGLQQINCLSLLRRLEHLSISSEGNPITSFTLWKPYVLFRLAHFSLRKINDVEVSSDHTRLLLWTWTHKVVYVSIVSTNCYVRSGLFSSGAGRALVSSQSILVSTHAYYSLSVYITDSLLRYFLNVMWLEPSSISSSYIASV